MDNVVYDFAKQLAYINKILKYLATSTKCVEDDTSFGRILQSIKVVLNHSQTEVAGYFDNGLESTFSLCSLVVNSTSSHFTSKSFAMKLFGLFSSYNGMLYNLSNTQFSFWEKGFAVLASMPINDKTTPTVLFSWLQSVNSVVCSDLGMKAVIVNGSLFAKIFNVSNSQFLFVRKEAISMISRIWMFLCAPNTDMHRQVTPLTQAQTMEALENFNKLLFSTTLDVLLGVLTKCIQCHGTNINYIDEKDLSYLKNLLQTKFRDKMVQQAKNHEAVFVNFLLAATLTSFEILDVEYVVELAFIALLQNPCKKFGYIVLFNVSQWDEYWKNNFSQLVEIPVYLSFGKNCSTLHLEKWSNKIMTAMKSRNQLTQIVCNCCYIWQKVFASERFVVSKKEIFECLVRISCCAFEVNMATHQATKISCHLFTNKRVGLAAMSCLQHCVNFVKQKGDCVLCMEIKLCTTLIAIMNSPEADDKVISKAGQTVSTSILSIFSCLIHGKEVKHIIYCLLDCVLVQCNNRQWEIRDSAFEVLVDCFQSTKGAVDVFKELSAVCMDLQMFNVVLSGLGDQVSFVRSSALKLAKEMLQIADFQKKKDIFTKTCDILRTDTEAFARRTAMQVLVSMICQTDNLCCEFVACLCANRDDTNQTDQDTEVSLANLGWKTFKTSVLLDLDWEVRLTAVQFMQKLHKTIKCDNCANLETALGSLIQPLVTCGDRALEESAVKFQQILNNQSETDINDTSLSQENVKFVTNELQDLLVEVMFLVTDGNHICGVSDGEEGSTINFLDCY